MGQTAFPFQCYNLFFIWLSLHFSFKGRQISRKQNMFSEITVVITFGWLKAFQILANMNPESPSFRIPLPSPETSQKRAATLSSQKSGGAGPQERPQGHRAWHWEVSGGGTSREKREPWLPRWFLTLSEPRALENAHFSLLNFFFEK